MTDTVLTMTGVDKSFRRTPVLQDCVFSVERGTVTALVGSNGAGKSTLMSLAVGLLRPDRGEVIVLGQRVGQRGITPGLSYLAQHKPLYPRLTVKEMLHFGRSTNPSWNHDYATELVDAADISMSAKIKSLSPGHRTRVALALALEAWSLGRARRAVAALMEMSNHLGRVCTRFSQRARTASSDMSFPSPSTVVSAPPFLPLS